MSETPTQTITAYIGNRIRERREYMGRSQAELARVLDKKVPAISLIESGRNNITAADLAIVAQFLRAPVEFFFGVKSPTEDEDAAAAYIREMSPDDRQTALVILKAIVENKGV